MEIKLKPIGTVKSSRSEIRDDHWGKETASIQLANWLSKMALDGIMDFSHVEVLFFMDRVNANKVELQSRHPRNNPDWPKVGILAQRGKNRPNQIGSTICKIKKVEENSLIVVGLDAVDGTPVIDIKPVVKEFLPRGTSSPTRTVFWR